MISTIIDYVAPFSLMLTFTALAATFALFSAGPEAIRRWYKKLKKGEEVKKDPTPEDGKETKDAKKEIKTPSKSKESSLTFGKVIWRLVGVFILISILCAIWDFGRGIYLAERNAESMRNNADNLRMQPLEVQYTQFGPDGTIMLRGELIQNDSQAMKFIVKYQYDARWYQTDFIGKPIGTGLDGRADRFEGIFNVERPALTGTWTLMKDPYVPHTWVGKTDDTKDGVVMIKLQLL